MAEEAQGQAETQPALGELNPAEAVAALASQIEKEENPQPARNDKGQFSKAEPKETEAKPEEEAKATEEEAPKPEEEAEIQPEPRRFKLKYKGEDREAEEPEVIELAQKGYDYTQKMQDLAKQREEIPSKVKAEVEARTKAYETQLETYKQAVLRMADPDVLNADLNKLSLEDPARALQLMVRRQQLGQTLQGIATEQARIAQQRETEAAEARKKEAAQALETIHREVPGWGNELYGKLLKTAVEMGYTQDEANAITDPRQIKLLNEARQWRDYVAAKPKTVEKRVASVPKVQKPGTAQEKPTPQAERFGQSMARLNKTGDRNAAVDALTTLIESGRL